MYWDAFERLTAQHAAFVRISLNWNGDEVQPVEEITG
jgi:hypothetical protein